MISDTTSAEFFDRKYQQDDDPWHFETSPYERHRYLTVIDSLAERRFARAFEPGCSVGVLTALLAPYCACLEAIDISETAVRRAQDRCSQFKSVNIREGSLPESIPTGEFDLIVFSELGYYFDKTQLARVVQDLSSHLAVGGLLVAAHWLGHSEDHLITGDDVHRIIRSCSTLALDGEWRHTGFRLDRMVRI